MFTNSTLQKNWDLTTALIDAEINNHKDIVDILLKDDKLKSAMFREKKRLLQGKNLNDALNDACKDGRIFEVVSIILTSPSIDLTANNNMALKNAIVYHHERIVKVLLSREKVRKEYEKNDLILSKIDDLDLALNLACKNGDFDAFLDMIISERVDASKNKNEALINALYYGHDKIARILLYNGKVKQCLLKTRNAVLDVYHDSFEEAYLKACELGDSALALAMITESRANELSGKCILKAYRNHQLETARIIARFDVIFRNMSYSYSNLQSFCRSGNMEGVAEILAAGNVDVAFQSNRALTVALAAGQHEIAELMVTEKNVIDLALKIKNEALEKTQGDAVKAIILACGSDHQNSSVVASILLLEDLKSSDFAVPALFEALRSSNFESFEILFKSVKVGSYLRNIFSTLLDDFKNKQSDLSEEAFLMTYFNIEHLDKVFAIIHHFFGDKKRKGGKYSDVLIEKGLLKMDKESQYLFTRIPEFLDYKNKVLLGAFQSYRLRANEAFELSCENGDIKAVCSFLLTSDFIPSLKSLELAVISQEREIVDFLLQNSYISKALLRQKERLFKIAGGDKQKAFRTAYSSNKVLDTLCLTVVNDPDIDVAENDNHAIRTSFVSNPEIFMILAYNVNSANPYYQIRSKLIQSYNGDLKKALIESCHNGVEENFLSIILIDAAHGNLDPSFDSNLALKTALRNNQHKMAKVLLQFKTVRLLKISENRELIKAHGDWKQAVISACISGLLDDVILLTIGIKKHDFLLEMLLYAVQQNHMHIVDYLRHIIPYQNRLLKFNRLSPNGLNHPVGDFHMIRRNLVRIC
jgi:ankyrin repeat protein